MPSSPTGNVCCFDHLFGMPPVFDCVPTCCPRSSSFTATGLPVCRSFANTTTPLAPLPITSCNANRGCTTSSGLKATVAMPIGIEFLEMILSWLCNAMRRGAFGKTSQSLQGSTSWHRTRPPCGEKCDHSNASSHSLECDAPCAGIVFNILQRVQASLAAATCSCVRLRGVAIETRKAAA